MGAKIPHDTGYSGILEENKTDCHDIAEILLKVVLNTVNQTKPTLVHDNFSQFWISCLGCFGFIAPIYCSIVLNSSISTLSVHVPDEGYSRNVSYTLTLISTFLFE